MPVTLDQSEEIRSIHLVGDMNIASAAELKNLLVESLASGTDLRVDLERATSLDITALQLLWAAERKAEVTGTGFRVAGPRRKRWRSRRRMRDLKNFPCRVGRSEKRGRGSYENCMTDKFKQAFQEEAREILVELEACASRAERKSRRQRTCGASLPRPAHDQGLRSPCSVSSELAAFTHNLENAFDEVRNGRLGVTSELINLSLAALDQIKAMLERPVTGVGQSRRSAEILAKLQKLTGLPDARAAGGPPATVPLLPTAAQGVAREWIIHFSPGPDLLRNGANPLMLLARIEATGKPSDHGQHGGGSAARRIGPRTLLHQLGHGPDNLRCARSHPRCLHFR